MRNYIIIVLMLLGLTFPGTSVVLADLNNGLVAYYPFNGNANDESGNGNNGTVNGATLTADRFGNTNGAYSFDGNNDYIEVEDSDILNFKSGSFSLSFWIKTTIQDAPIVSKGKDAPNGNGETAWNIQCENTSQYKLGVRFDVYDGNNGGDLITTGSDAFDNKWHHVVMILNRNNNLVIAYLDNQQKDSADISKIGIISNSYNLLFGKRGDGWGYLNGYIDDIRIYNRTLSASEIVELYNYVSTPTTPTVTTKSATNVNSTSATLNGTVNANGGTTTAWFEYGITSGTYSSTTSTQTISSGWSDTSVTTDISGLSSKTTYYFRLVAQNSVGTTYGSETSFATTAPPTVTTGSATNVTMISATLNGTVNANGTSTTAWFEYGKSSGAYDKTTTTQSVSGSSDTSVSIYVSSLSSGTGYYYRLVAQNDAGVSYGSENSFSTITSSTPVPTPTPTSNNGLVAYYPFNGNANDESGNGNHGTVYGATLTTDRLGNANSAYSFDGNDDYIRISDSSSLSPTTAITIAAWVNLNVAGNAWQPITFKEGEKRAWWIGFHENSASKLHWSNENLSSWQLDCNIPSTLKMWRHIVVTYQNEGVGRRIYVDGELTCSDSATGNIPDTSGYIYIGGLSEELDPPRHICGSGCWQPINGKLDDIRIYNRALSASEIQELYSGITPTPTSTPSPTTTPITSPAPTLPPLPTPQVSPSPLQGGVVLGFVYDEDEDPMRDVTVTIVGANGRSPLQNSTETDGEGYYEFTGLAAGDYTLTYEKKGYITENRDVSLEEDETVVDVDDIFMEEIQKGSIYGYVVDIRGAALEKVKLKLKGVKTKVTKTASSDRDGFFEFEDLDPDTYRVAVTKKFYKKVNKVVKLEEGEDKEIEIEMKKTSKRVKEMVEDGQE